jgi:DNA-binding NtrC family response regulator
MEDRSLDARDRANIEIALIRIHRMRLNLDAGKTREALDGIEKSVAGDPTIQWKLRLIRAELLLFSDGNSARAESEYALLEGDLRNTQHEFLYALTANGLGIARMFLGDCTKAEDCFQDATSILRRLNNQMQYAYSLNNYSFLKKIQCRYSEAEALAKRALRVFQRLGVLEGQVLCYNNLGVVAFKTGAWGYAEYCYNAAIRLKHQVVDGMNDDRFANDFADVPVFTELNLQHLLVCQRRFDLAASGLTTLLEASGSFRNDLAHLLVLEFLGELAMEISEFGDAERHLTKAKSAAERTGPCSDYMTETARRQAQLALAVDRVGDARRHALDCIRLCRKIGDKHELGAALRILGEVYVRQGLPRKAVSAFEAGINTLKSIGECYELMRCCIAYSEFLIDAKGSDADIYLLEAKQLCKKLEIDFYMTKIMLLSSKYAYNNNDYMAARAYLKKADEIADKLQDCDNKKLKLEIRKFYKTLEETILQTSMKSSQKLKSIGKIYEDARFPIEELKPELAAEVALNVGADQLFLVRKKNKGFKVPIKYNISAENAKRLIRFQLREHEQLFEVKAPTVIPLPAGNTLVCVPGQMPVGYLLCTLIDKEKSFTPRELEFLFASLEAMERVAEEYAELPPYLDMDDFMDGGEEKLTHPGGHFQDILTLDPELIKMIRLAERASDSNVPILLEGETGVGKELFANAIHAQSPRKNKQFIAVNAGGVPLSLLESQLFGHVRGAFTDAVTDRHGLIEEARGGTIFFDEVGEMAEELQVKLLRLLENGEFRRLGENRLRIADIRVISATNKDLERRVKEGLFREDLYYRLATVRFKIPPLRNRKRDVEFLVRHFINEGLVRIGKPRRRISVDVKALEAFEIYGWPGNVRELRNELLRILSLIGQGDVIRFGMLSEHVKAAFQSKDEDGGFLETRVDRYERRLILKALEENEWSRNKTAEQIGIPRTTLLFKMKRLNIVAQ